ncbi:LysR substrate-binding domain-containing protein [Actibacterium sp. MT2.3-13A]|uniref:LysR substrate-binding domain-containing protein n=1 Tax=Actibacterium sp. MT2.3-13A TaxID=2828332 RepID=UPI001BA45DE4|nr:LysR substrate-binding domain-containing protein [Actibacterium sp. MT2.3-13A]
MPSFQQLRYLVAVADFLHFRRAAEACHVTQPTLSAQLKELEQKLGVQLVERSRTRVLLTPIGARIAERGRLVLREIDEIRALAKSGQAMLEGTIRIGVVQSLGSYFLPLIVPDLHETHPRLGLYMREGLPQMLLRGIEDGTLDLLFFPLPLNRGELASLPLFREPIHVVAPRDHRLAAGASVDPGQLRGETILSLEPGHKLYEQVRGLCDEYGAELSHDYEGTSLDTLRQMVAMGMGISLMPALYVKSEVAHQDIVVARPLKGAAPSRTIGMVWRRQTAREAEFRALAALICGILKNTAPEVAVVA